METRCIPCRSQHDYGAPSAPNYVENGELSATATRALDDVLRRVDDAIARGWRRNGDDSVYTGDPGVAFYLMRRGDVDAARELRGAIGSRRSRRSAGPASSAPRSRPSRSAPPTGCPRRARRTARPAASATRANTLRPTSRPSSRSRRTDRRPREDREAFYPLPRIPP